MIDVNLGDVVEVLDPLVSPSVRQLRLSVYFRLFAIGPVNRCIRCVSVLLFVHPWFLMIHLPWVVTTFLSS